MKCPRQLYGPATVNDKGQIVIPADARRDLGIGPDTKLMVIGHQKRKVLVLVPAEAFERKSQGLMRFFFNDEEN
jgi:AbrB family looped-hinge helix DNA binding protein